MSAYLQAILNNISEKSEIPGDTTRHLTCSLEVYKGQFCGHHGPGLTLRPGTVFRSEGIREDETGAKVLTLQVTHLPEQELQRVFPEREGAGMTIPRYQVEYRVKK